MTRRQMLWFDVALLLAFLASLAWGIAHDTYTPTVIQPMYRIEITEQTDGAVLRTVLLQEKQAHELDVAAVIAAVNTPPKAKRVRASLAKRVEASV